ncbi:MAG: hypothetical protein P1U86_13660 [Verrucomicrobiales bacterium]|nr:hypothetical protein [Verrucomicrobiales bacterium]
MAFEFRMIFTILSPATNACAGIRTIRRVEVIKSDSGGPGDPTYPVFRGLSYGVL